MKKKNNAISLSSVKITVAKKNKLKDWLKYLYIINNKPVNKQILFNYFFDKFASSPQLFYEFLEFFKKYLLELTDNEKQKKMSENYLDILAPLCERFNFFEERDFLNDLCFKIIEKDKHEETKKVLAKYEKESKKIIETITAKLHEVLKEKKFDYELIGRYKNIYSSYKKIKHRMERLLKLKDIFAFRIILNSDSQDECFEVLNLLHDTFHPIPDQFKDYITIPKINGYQSLHTGLGKIIDDLDLSIEIQIRTREMDNFAKNGLAAHWIYARDKKSRLINEKEKNLLNYLQCIGHSQEKEKTIYCFSYSGDIVKIPKNSTALDFAYQIHTDLGNKSKIAIINEVEKPLHYRIKEGDQIKIIQSAQDQIEEKWLNYSRTKYAYKKIFDYLKKYEKKQ